MGYKPSRAKSSLDTAKSYHLMTGCLSSQSRKWCRAAGVVPAGGVRARVSAEPRRAADQLRGQHRRRDGGLRPVVLAAAARAWVGSHAITHATVFWPTTSVYLSYAKQHRASMQPCRHVMYGRRVFVGDPSSILPGPAIGHVSAETQSACGRRATKGSRSTSSLASVQPLPRRCRVQLSRSRPGTAGYSFWLTALRSVCSVLGWNHPVRRLYATSRCRHHTNGAARRAQAFCADADASAREAALAGTVSVAAAVGPDLRSSLLAAAADAGRRQLPDGGRLWRGRLALAEQAASLAALCTQQARTPDLCPASQALRHASPCLASGSNHSDDSAVRLQDVCATLLPALLELCGDPVAAVRRAAAQQVGRVLSAAGLLTPECTQPSNSSAQDVVAQVRSLVRSSSFQQRISYAHAFGSIVQHASRRDVSTLYLPSFLELAYDTVLDVRLAAFNVASAVAESCGHEVPCSRRDDAAAAHVQPGVWAVLNDMRLHEVVSLATADSDTAVAQTACVCRNHLGNVLLYNDA